jgi:exodeoxyribonuclease-3
MLMGSWNVNGLRACVRKGHFMRFLKAHDFDVFGVQEIRTLREQAQFRFDGYFEYWYPAETKGYSGTLVISKREAEDAFYGLGQDAHDHEGRVITLDFGDFYFVTVYTPNAKTELQRLDYRMEWDDAFRAHLTGLAAKKHVVVCGDLNVAHTELDLAHPKANAESAGFTPQERGKFGELLDAGFLDAFRLKYPDRAGAYTWWTFIGDARSRNVGWRIDYFLVSDSLRDAVSDAFIYEKVKGSDHCPVGLDIKL